MYILARYNLIYVQYLFIIVLHKEDNKKFII